jgi:hypothetical protein
VRTLDTVLACSNSNLRRKTSISLAVRGDGSRANLEKHVNTSESVVKAYLLPFFDASSYVTNRHLIGTKSSTKYFSTYFGVQSESEFFEIETLE